MALHIIILAAGQGKRMLSSTPKVLHKVGGKAMLERVVDTALELNPEKIHVIFGHGGEKLKQALPDLPVNWVLQSEQLGTGHAVKQALPHIPSDSQVLILSADVPLIRKKTLQELIDRCPLPQTLGLLVVQAADPFGLGRIVRNQTGNIIAIVEEKDASNEQRQIQEIYSGICCTSALNLNRWLPALSNENAQQEYYLTEIISMAVKEQQPITWLQTQDYIETQGVNNRVQLQDLERVWQKQLAIQLMHKGATLADAARIDIRGELTCGQDVFIDVNNVFIGEVVIGNHCHIEPNCVLTNVTLKDHCHIQANSVIEGSTIGDHSSVGPFARIRPGTVVGAHCKIGNFVETKKAIFDENSKASHLSYLGDVDIGKDVNIGAGTITCNYDGINKYKTTIKDGAFIGSDTQLIAPIVVGEYATIGAGTTLRKDAPAGELTLMESKQKTLTGWKRKNKKL